MADVAQASVIQLADQVSAGFAALSGEYQLLFEQQRQLESKLSWAKQQYLDALKRFSPATLSQDHINFLQDLERVGSERSHPQSEWIDHLDRSEDADRRGRASLIRLGQTATATLENSSEAKGVRIWSGPSADKKTSPLRNHGQVDLPQLEQDFTTLGTPSKLGCPFAPGSGRQSPLATPRSSTSRLSLRGRRSKRPSFTDPIRAEICGNDVVSATPSVDGSAAVCPIRFLDQHAPEDVAKYFENHKHEIPRSHEVCIKRFQSNAESIQQLDRKYGNLVSMIQGLGQKHQEYLPTEPEEDGEGAADENHAGANVKNWAQGVTASLHDLTPAEEDPPDHAVDEARTAHFDRPLKEIRVGESPSRPWGISIPAKYTNAESSSSVGSAPTASPPLPLDTGHPVGEPAKQPAKCPFDHRALGIAKVPEANEAGDKGKPPLQQEKKGGKAPNPVQAERPEPHGKDAPASPKVIPQMVFNGPVFLGYPPDQLMTLLQNSNLGGIMR